MARTFSMRFTAATEHIDVLGHVNNSVWVQWMEQVSTSHWESHADPHDVAAWIWVVTRHEIDYRGNIRLGESVTAKTWIDTPPKGARFDRTIQFVDEAGKTIVTARTSWAMLDAETHRLTRVPERLARHFLVETDPK